MSVKINEVIKDALKAEKRTNRWLRDELKENFDISLNDAQISNRLSGEINFTFEEVKACKSILNIPAELILSE